MKSKRLLKTIAIALAITSINSAITASSIKLPLDSIGIQSAYALDSITFSSSSTKGKAYQYEAISGTQALGALVSDKYVTVLSYVLGI